MAKKAANTTKDIEPKKTKKVPVSEATDMPVKAETKPKKETKKAESETKIVSKAKSTKSAKEEPVKIKKTSAKVKTEAKDEAISAKTVEVTKPETKTKKKAETTKIEELPAKSEAKKEKTKKVTSKITEVPIVVVASGTETPKKRSTRKKATETPKEVAPEVPAVKEKKTKIKTEPEASSSVAKLKRTTKKSKIETDSSAKPASVEEKVSEAKAEVKAKPVAESAYTRVSRPTQQASNIKASEVKEATPKKVSVGAEPLVAVPPATKTAQEVVSQPSSSKKKIIADKAKISKQVVVDSSSAKDKSSQATAPPVAQVPLSKSARRRAKKKAKKLREQALLAEQNAKKTNEPVVAKAPLPQIQPPKPAIAKEQEVSKNKKWENKKSKVKSKFASNVSQNVAPIYSTHSTVNSTNTTKIASINPETAAESTAKEPQYVSHRKLQPKPIPWADLSKLQVDKSDKKSAPVKEQLVVVPVDITKLLTPTQWRDPFFQNFYRDVERFVISEMLVENGSKVLVAVSGGVDSIVMLDVFANLSSKYNFIVYVAHYNHNLRGEAANNDVQFVKELAASYNLPFYTSTGKVLQHAERTGMSVEESARFLRYYFLERTACTLKTDFVATAHTADDSAETFLLNLFRGTGLTGLSGIPSRRQMVKDVIIIRPFLNFSKQKLKEYAEKRNLDWHEDETNLQDKYTRNKIRNDLIPKLKNEYSQSIIDIINRSAKLIQGADRIIHNYVRTHLPSIVFDISNEAISIKLTLFKTFDEFIQGEMLQTILMKYFKLLPLPMKIIDRIIKLEQSDTGAICEISKNIIAIKDRQTLIIARKVITNKVNQKIERKGKFTIGNLTFILKEVSVEEVELTKNPCIEYIDAELVSNTLLIRNWEHGDDFSPLGMENTMKLSDFLVNEKVSVLEKPNVLVLANSNNEIVWVCKYRINDKFKVTPDTKKVLRIEIKEHQK